MITKEFDLELAKKIVAGEVKGRIKTREGAPVRIICWDAKNDNPIVALREEEGREFSTGYAVDGRYVFRSDKEYDLLLEVNASVEDLKPFDKVLVRDNDDEVWWCDLFSHIDNEDDYKFCCVGRFYKQCIPFEGNEHLLGTNDKPE